jgi:hypothetical protein
MKTKLILLFAIIGFAFTAADLKAQTCQNFYVRNNTVCSFSYTLVWNCGGSLTYVNNTVSGNTSNIEANPGTWPNCCTFSKIGIMDCNGNTVTLNSSNTTATICDCTGATVTVDLMWNGSAWGGVWIH